MLSGPSLLWALGATIYAPTVASTHLQTRPAPVEIVGGEETEPGDFDGVVAIVAGQGLCTGTVVADKLVLTAGHCLSEVQNANQIRVYFGEEIDGDSSVAATDFGVHPDFCRECDDDIFDYGFVVIEQNFTVPGGFLLPITDQAEWDAVINKGDSVTLVGFGEDPDAAGSDAGIGTKRRVETIISDFSPKGLEFFAGGDGRDSCQGDSGGPAFVRLEDGNWRLAGITSRGSDPCGKGGFYGAPYAALPWVREASGVDLCGNGCGDCNCVDMTPPPEPDEGCSIATEHSAGWAGFALAGLVLLSFRRRPTS